jgi:hypothetical protein
MVLRPMSELCEVEGGAHMFCRADMFPQEAGRVPFRREFQDKSLRRGELPGES